MKKIATTDTPIFTNTLYNDFIFFNDDASTIEYLPCNISDEEMEDWWKEIDAFKSNRKATDEDWIDREVRIFVRNRKIDGILKDD